MLSAFPNWKHTKRNAQPRKSIAWRKHKTHSNNTRRRDTTLPATFKFLVMSLKLHSSKKAWQSPRRRPGQVWTFFELEQEKIQHVPQHLQRTRELEFTDKCRRRPCWATLLKKTSGHPGKHFAAHFPLQKKIVHDFLLAQLDSSSFIAFVSLLHEPFTTAIWRKLLNVQHGKGYAQDRSNWSKNVCTTWRGGVIWKSEVSKDELTMKTMQISTQRMYQKMNQRGNRMKTVWRVMRKNRMYEIDCVELYDLHQNGTGSKYVLETLVSIERRLSTSTSF